MVGKAAEAHVDEQHVHCVGFVKLSPEADAIAQKKEQVLADAKLLVPEYFEKVEAERALPALQTLVDPQTFILGQDTEADVRGFQINFASSFGDSMHAFLRGILTEDYAAVGPRAGADGLLYPDPLEVESGTMPGTPIDPAAGFSVQLYAAAFGMAWIPLTYDDVFFESARVYVEGSAEAVTIPAAERVRFRDPFTSLRYVAGSYPDAALVETGLGARMLLHAQALNDAGALFELDRYMDTIRFQRSLSWYYGFGP